MAKHSLLIIGISGVTCGGKTTTTMKLKDMLPNTTVFSQDDYFLNVEDPRHTWIPELNHINFEVMTGLDMAKMREDILHFIKVNNYERVDITDTNNTYINNNGIQYRDTEDILKIICTKIKGLNMKILLIEGFSIFNYKPMLNLFNLKYYFTLDKEECLKRRLERVYEPPDCSGYFENYVWPEHLDQLKDIKSTLKEVRYLDGTCENVNIILKHILQCIQNN